jgi:hypothetical protein
MPTANEKKNDNSQDDISKGNISDQSIVDAIKENHKDQSLIKKFFKSEHVRGWMIILVTGTLAILAFSQWQVMNDNLEQTRNLVTESKRQVEAAKASADAAKTSADVAQINAKIAEQSLNLERSKSKAQLECRIWGRDLYVGGQDDRTRIILICRNLSPRATAVIDINVRDEKGGHLGAGGRGYMDRIKLPFRIDSWGLTAMNFIIEQDDEKRMKDILIKDMEDNEYEVTLSSKWTGASQKTR